jgi:AhpD family alkylhydroperoxidase
VPAFSKAMAHLDTTTTRELDRVGVPAGLRDLLKLRASQINGCAYCVDMHATDAASNGESQQRIHAVSVWAESPFFTEKERAAFAFTESVTRLADTHMPTADYDSVAEHWSAEEVGALLALIVTINAWNGLAVASRAWEPKLEA